MSGVLNSHLLRLSDIFLPCDAFNISALRNIQQSFLAAASPELLALYPAADGRAARHDAQSLELLWQAVDGALEAEESEGGSAATQLAAVHRDGLCHSAVLSLVHHVPFAARRLLLRRWSHLPLLPHSRHPAPRRDLGATEAAVHDEYASAVSCQQCHTGKVAAKWRDAELPPPLPVDQAQPGRERLRSCDYQNQPGCGPCEGLGGPRWGDGSTEFSPVNCTVVAQPAEVPPASRVAGRYPKQGTASIVGGTRSPLVVRPDPALPGNYTPIAATLYMGWDAGWDAGWDNATARQRYDFHQPDGSTVSQLYLQSRAQACADDAGAMFTLVPRLPPALGGCFCIPAVAGNMHADSFVAHDPLDPLDLPASEGGLAYLGRVRLRLDDGTHSRTALADHYLKWAFHLLVDADQQSADYGLPLRLYGAYGVRQVFSDWAVGPTPPAVWAIPRGCKLLGQACRSFGDFV